LSAANVVAIAIGAAQFGAYVFLSHASYLHAERAR
jgi:hypothetical protein